MAFGESVFFAVIIEQPNGFIEPFESHIKLNTLVPRHSPIVVVVHHQHRRLYFGGIKQRRIFDILHRFVPKCTTNSGLCFFVLCLSRSPRLPTDSAIGTRHIDHGRTSFCCSKQVGLGYQIGRLIAAPTMTRHSNSVFIDKTLGNHIQHPRHNAIISTLAWIARFINNIWHKNQISVARKIAKIDVRPNRPWGKMRMNIVRIFFIKIRHHRIFFICIKVVWFVQKPF